MSEYNKKQLTIREIINTGFTFLIPDYQRGYRWGKTEVRYLLNDIHGIDKNQKNPYCLQPVAFDTSEENNKKMIVVDGQQRLTTIFLILKYIAEVTEKTPQYVWEQIFGDEKIEDFHKCYSLEYKSKKRGDSFADALKDLNTVNENNIDLYHITKAYETIKAWAEVELGKQLTKKIDFAKKLLDKTSVIWYEIDPKVDGDAHNYFSKTNTGKIPLTSSELIKANLMLDDYCIKKESGAQIIEGRSDDSVALAMEKANREKIEREHLQNERIKISRQWDEIESNLRKDEFWYFLTEGSDQYEDTRIDFIFDILSEKFFPETNPGEEYDEFMKFNEKRGSFIIIANYLECHKDDENEVPVGLSVWKKTHDIYMLFKAWYEDREWYHLIGYLISVGKYDAKGLLDDFSDKKYKSKTAIRKEITDKIGEHIGFINNNRQKKNKDDYVKYLNNLSYNNNYKMINDTLLLFNIISILNDSKQKDQVSRDSYFPFSRYKKERWNLEHIHAKADATEFTSTAAEEYRNYISIMIAQINDPNNKDYIELDKAIKEYDNEYDIQIGLGMNQKNATKYAATKAAGVLVKYMGSDLDDSMLNGIGNMALLDEVTNKSYKNVPFFMKRMIIGDIVRGKKKDVSRFIPFCTRNVFDKTYTSHPNNMLHWTNEDCDEYKKVITETIWDYFNKGDADNE